MTTLRLATCLLALSLLSGCVSKVDYVPNTNLVAEKGPEDAAKEFEAVLKRAKIPQIRRVTLGPDQFAFKWRGAAGPVGVYAHDGEKAVYFNTVESIDIFANHKVRVMGGSVLAEVTFTGLGDAQRFADLVMSFKATPPDEQLLTDEE